MLDEKLEVVSHVRHESKIAGGIACGMLLTIVMTELEAKRLQWEREGYDEETILEMQWAALREILNSKFGMNNIKDEG